MNVVTPKLLPSQYGAANDLKTAVQQALDYQKLHPGSAGDTAITEFFTELGGVDAGSAIVSPGDPSNVTTYDSAVVGSGTLDVVDGSFAGVVLDNDQYLVKDGDVLDEAGGGTITVSVVAGVPTYTYTAP